MTQIEVPDSPHKRAQLYRRLTMIYNLSGEALKYLAIAELKEEQTKRKVIAIENWKKPLTREYIDKPERRKTMKEDLYDNLLKLMERGEVKLLDDDSIRQSLQSVQYEYVNGKLRIFGRYTHIVEGIIRGAWCTKQKVNKLWISYI